MRRRQFLGASVVAMAQAKSAHAEQDPSRWEPRGCITDVEGIKVGHFTEQRRPTGCTVVMYEAGAVGGVDVRGGAPGTRDIELLDPTKAVDVVHAIMLSGGSAFGLAAADGAMRWFEEKKIGYAFGGSYVPIVPAAILFDLPVGDGRIRPDAEAGYKACAAARATPSEQGNVGAGAGATVGKMLGHGRAMKGGLGCASLKMPSGLVVGALIAVNAAGDIFHPGRGRLLAGARTGNGKGLADVMELMRRGALPALAAKPRENSTIGVVATNAPLTKADANKVAQMAHDGLARAIQPVHTLVDGDTIFALATGRLKAGAAARNLSLIGALAAEVTSMAVVSAILSAKSLLDYPACVDL